MDVATVIEEQIDPRILEALFANFPNSEIAMLELTDNAIGDRVPGEKMVLTIRVSPSRIKVLNLGGYGMGLDRLRSFLAWGKSEATGVFRFFGQGGKAAIGYLGKRFKVTSFPKDGDRSYIIIETEDWTRRLTGELKKFPVKEDKTLVFNTGRVEIEIYNITRKPNIKRLRSLLRATYSKLIESGELQILFNDKWLAPELLEYDNYNDFKESTPHGLLIGRLGITENSLGGGIRCYSQNRLITVKETFGLNPTEYDLTKLIGEVHLDFVPVMPNKISYDTSGQEWLCAETIIKENLQPFLEQIKGMAEVPPNLKRMDKELSEFINRMLREADMSFESQGRKSPQDISRLTLEYDKGEKESPSTLSEPKTPPELNNKGETSRLGILDFRTEAMETENVRCVVSEKTAILNLNFPMAKAIYSKPSKTISYWAYALESVALEVYKDKVASPIELVDKINALLSLLSKRPQRGAS